jgi:hypothetical protein
VNLAKALRAPSTESMSRTAKPHPGQAIRSRISECCSPWSSPRHEAIKFNSVESTVRYLGIEVDDALAIAEQVDV